ncbi:hypothetical protein AAC387_Pa04g0905 [Persea americana]
MKKMKKVVLDSSPAYVFDEEAKNRFKHQSLMQDFSELEKETEEMKKKLQKAKRKKLRLLAEVRFLRRRYKYLLKNPSQKTPSERLVQPKLPNVQPKLPNIRNQSSLKERNYREKEASIKRTPAIDLNQISRGEETEEFVWEPPRMDKKLERPSAEGDASAGDLKWVCRDVGNGPSRSGKRKISWQDQVALRV